jgi:NAD(P)-dependent dehydrogenase (short-subunit alcohol dehydrogenase family)
VALVVGASAGIGMATAEGLLRQGFRVILGCRNASRGQLALAALQKTTGQVAELLTLDLESLDSLQRAVEELHRRCDRLDVLVHNAGVVYPQRRTTAEGWEAQLAVIYLSPFWLTQQLEGGGSSGYRAG